MSLLDRLKIFLTPVEKKKPRKKAAKRVKRKTRIKARKEASGKSKKAVKKKTQKKITKKTLKKALKKVKPKPKKTPKKPHKKIGLNKIKKTPLKKHSLKKSKSLFKKLPREKEIGIVTHYFGKISVGIIKLKSALRVGDKIHIKGAHDDFTQLITSMQVNHKDIAHAKKGEEIGIKAAQAVHENDKVYKLL